MIGEDALIIHEIFENSDELKFHLSKGTAEKYKKDIDEVATPEAYFFRGRSRGPSERTPSSCTCQPRTPAMGAASPDREEA